MNKKSDDSKPWGIVYNETAIEDRRLRVGEARQYPTTAPGDCLEVEERPSQKRAVQNKGRV